MKNYTSIICLVVLINFACTNPNELLVDQSVSTKSDMSSNNKADMSSNDKDQTMNMLVIDADQKVEDPDQTITPDMDVIIDQMVIVNDMTQVVVDQAVEAVDASVELDTSVEVMDESIPVCTSDMAIYGDWSECEFASPCDQVGTQARSAQYCIGGEILDSEETQECTRDTTDVVVFSMWTECAYVNDCAETGERVRNYTVCQNGEPVDLNTTQECTRETDDAVVFSMWTECAYADDCIETGERVRNYTVCQNGEPVELTLAQECTRQTDDVVVNSMWTECAGFESVCDNSGMRTRNYTMCIDGVPVPYSIEAACTRDTNETVIEGNETYGDCGGFESTCDQTGTQSKSYYVCMNEQPELRTVDIACSRDTQDVVVDDSALWGDCGGFESTCDQTGTQSRTIIVCKDGENFNQVLTQDCTRDTNGVIADEGIWGDCGGFESTCDQTGTRSKTYSQCVDGVATSYNATEDCTRDTNDVVVDATALWTECAGFDSTCDQTGTHQKTFIICSNGAEVPDVRSRECVRDTNGIITNPGTWSSCGGFDTDCDQTGTRSMTYTQCLNGIAVDYPVSEACTRDTNGTITNPGVWGECGGFDTACDQTGTRSKTYTQCLNGVAVDYPTSEACTRDTNGIITNPGVWSDCGMFTSVCDQTGTRSMTYTQCSNGAAVDYPISEACTRNTNGVSCGTGQTCSAGYCY